MHSRVEFDKKKEVLRLRTRHMPTREHESKKEYNRKRENKNWRKEIA
jgi:hypothetical protein